MENSHKRMLMEMEEKHRRELAALQAEKDQALAEETQVTLIPTLFKLLQESTSTFVLSSHVLISSRTAFLYLVPSSYDPHNFRNGSS